MNNEDNVAPMYEYLTGFEKYNTDLPVYIENALSTESLDLIHQVLAEIGIVEGANFYVDDLTTNKHPERYMPRIMPELSRLVAEFPFPESVEKEIDAAILPLYKEDLKLSHFSYLDYDAKYSNYETPPSLPPHIDAAETILTFNYQIDSNIEWDVFIDDKPYSLKTGDALIFSSLNQVHWRPKRIWKKGDFTKILTVNYSPLDNWRFTGQGDPIDVRYRREARQKYMETLNQHPRFVSAWSIYNSMGDKEGIPGDKLGLIVEE